MDDESMSLVATFGLEHEADLARALLESAGIPAFLRNENVNRINPFVYAMSDGGWQLYVPASAEGDARDLLNSRVSSAQLAEEAE
jgi:Putative prokaryotic signal transducing protein